MCWRSEEKTAQARVPESALRAQAEATSRAQVVVEKAQAMLEKA